MPRHAICLHPRSMVAASITCCASWALQLGLCLNLHDVRLGLGAVKLDHWQDPNGTNQPPMSADEERYGPKRAGCAWPCRHARQRSRTYRRSREKPRSIVYHKVPNSLGHVLNWLSKGLELALERWHVTSDLGRQNLRCNHNVAAENGPTLAEISAVNIPEISS